MLDIGCGDGKLTAEIAHRVPGAYVLGIDNATDMVDFARRSYTALSNISFKLVDAQALYLASDFDVAFSNPNPALDT